MSETSPLQRALAVLRTLVWCHENERSHLIGHAEFTRQFDLAWGDAAAFLKEQAAAGIEPPSRSESRNVTREDLVRFLADAIPTSALEVRKADCLIICAPEWFKREDFPKWRSHKDVAKWDWVGEGQDVFLVWDEGDLSDDGFLPEDIARTIHTEADRVGMTLGTIWIKAV
jgi:hypothetical protein